MMNDLAKSLWVLRHGEAAEHAQHDTLRQLTAYGCEQVHKQAHFLHEQSACVDEIWVSPYLRAQQTAHELLKHWQSLVLHKTTRLLEPEASLSTLLKELRASKAKNILLVSHQPLVNRLVAYLVRGEACGQLVDNMSTAALACLRADEWFPGWADLDFIRQVDI